MLNKAKTINEYNVTTVLYNEKQQLYLEADALGVDPSARLLQVWDRIWFQMNKAPNSAALWQIPFTSKSLTSTETHYSKNKHEAQGIFHGLGNSITTVLPMK